MSRSDEAEYDSDVDIDALLSEEPHADRQGHVGRGERQEAAGRGERADESTEERSGLRGRLPSPSRPSAPVSLPRFTARGVGLALVVCVGAFLAASAVVPLGGVAGLVGVFVGAFLLALAGRGRYLELAVAGAGTAAVGSLLDRLLFATLADVAVPLTVVGGSAGLLAAVLGCYFGRDLRAGLTRSV